MCSVFCLHCCSEEQNGSILWITATEAPPLLLCQSELSCALRSVFCALRSMFYVLCSALCALRSALCALRSELCALRSAFCALCSLFCVLWWKSVWILIVTDEQTAVSQAAPPPGTLVAPMPDSRGHGVWVRVSGEPGCLHNDRQGGRGNLFILMVAASLLVDTGCRDKQKYLWQYLQ